MRLEAQLRVVTAERDRLDDHLRAIRQHGGKVCPEFELCTHDYCSSSVAAWMLADNALAGKPLPDDYRAARSEERT